jgi:aryl-alcohol dehydrogenase-like predicted oxidoreductase
MDYSTLGKTDIKVSRIAFGAGALGGPGQWGWGPVNDTDSIAAIRHAHYLGINFIDTADAYGAGHSESVIGRAIRSRRHEFVIATKFATVLDDQGNEIGTNGSAAYIMKACEASLRRLGTDYIDLYQMHAPDETTPIEETMTALEKLRKQGKICAAGVSNFTLPMVEECLRWGRLDSLQPPYSLFNRAIESDLLPWSKTYAISLLAYAPMAHGLLAGGLSPDTKFTKGDWRGQDKHYQGETYLHNLEIVEQLKILAAESGHSVAQLAIAWVLAKSDRIIALAGARNPNQITETAAASDWHLSSEDNARIEMITANAVPVLV